MAAKGLGRFVWLKAFARVEIDSHYRNGANSTLLNRRFSFIANDDEQPCIVSPSTLSAPRTTVQLIGFRNPYCDDCPRRLDAIAQRLVGHFLPLFLDPDAPAITLSDESDEIDLKAFFDEHFRAPATRHELAIGERRFTLHGFRLHSAAFEHHELVYGAHYREVITERLVKFLPNLRNRLADAAQGNFAYLAFVQGDYLNEKVNVERTDFSIPREAAAEAGNTAGTRSAFADLFAGEISLKAIRDAALVVIAADLKPHLDEINIAKEAALSNYIAAEAPQYRPLMKYKDEFIDQIWPGVPEGPNWIPLSTANFTRGK